MVAVYVISTIDATISISSTTMTIPHREAHMNVLVTGAHGTVGTAITDNLSEGYDFTLLDRREPDDDQSPPGRVVVADVTDYDAIRPAFDGQDAVVHLAGYPTTDGTFEQVRDANVTGTYNVLEAARDAGVGTVVFASSNHAVGMFEVENAPEIYHGTDLRVDHTVPIRPDSHYGSSKAAGEAWGRQYAENHGLRFYAIRICSVRQPEYDHPFGDAERGVDNGDWVRGSDDYEEQAARMKAMWQSRRDCAQLFECCLQAGRGGDIDEEASVADDDGAFDVFYGVSANERRWFDIDHAREAVGYEPEDNGEEWDEPPARDEE